VARVRAEGLCGLGTLLSGLFLVRVGMARVKWEMFATLFGFGLAQSVRSECTNATYLFKPFYKPFRKPFRKPFCCCKHVPWVANLVKTPWFPTLERTSPAKVFIRRLCLFSCFLYAHTTQRRRWCPRWRR
jgi:hypothetical protein